MILMWKKKRSWLRTGADVKVTLLFPCFLVLWTCSVSVKYHSKIPAAYESNSKSMSICCEGRKILPKLPEEYQITSWTSWIHRDQGKSCWCLMLTIPCLVSKYLCPLHDCLFVIIHYALTLSSYTSIHKLYFVLSLRVAFDKLMSFSVCTQKPYITIWLDTSWVDGHLGNVHLYDRGRGVGNKTLKMDSESF